MYNIKKPFNLRSNYKHVHSEPGTKTEVESLSLGDIHDIDYQI
jgi:hypothetical protein